MEVAMSSSLDQLYRTEDVGFSSGSLRLAGTVYLPTTMEQHAAVVLIHGSGPETRDGGGYLKDVAVSFATRGIACLTYDKRGVGASQGDWMLATLDDLAGDAVAGFDLLAEREEIDPRRIGVWGFSQGGWIAPLAAVRSGRAAFVVSVSGNAVSPAIQEMYRIEAELRADGFSETDITDALALGKLAHDVVRTGRGQEQLVNAYRKVWDPRALWLDYVGIPLSPDQLAAAGDETWRWARHVLFYDPAPTLERIRVPVLAIFGTLDRKTPFRESAAGFERCLSGRPDADLTIRFFPGANHGLRVAQTGGRRESNDSLPYVSGYFEAMAEWILAKTRTPGSDHRGTSKRLLRRPR
jgi:pimeloyl-ACP methyl ester carboxylesterase